MLLVRLGEISRNGGKEKMIRHDKPLLYLKKQCQTKGTYLTFSRYCESENNVQTITRADEICADISNEEMFSIGILQETANCIEKAQNNFSVTMG